MNRYWVIGVIGGLTLAVVGLSTALAVSLSTDDGGTRQQNCQAAGTAMSEQMRQIMGDEGYAQMVKRMRGAIHGTMMYGTPMSGAMMQGMSQEQMAECLGWMGQ